MSMTDPTRGTAPVAGTGTDVRGTARDSMRAERRYGDERRDRAWRETKLSFITTEFWAMIAGVAALVVLYNYTDNPDLTLWRTSLLCTVIASAYIVSRGWAKSGSHADGGRRDREGYRDRGGYEA